MIQRNGGNYTNIENIHRTFVSTLSGRGIEIAPRGADHTLESKMNIIHMPISCSSSTFKQPFRLLGTRAVNLFFSNQ